MTSGKIPGQVDFPDGTPTSAGVTLATVNDLASLDGRAPCYFATAGALPSYTYNNGASGVGATLTANGNGALSVDGIAVAAGQRILVKSETGSKRPNNGIYVVTQPGDAGTPYILTRAVDFNTPSTVGPGILVGVEDGSGSGGGATNNNTVWISVATNPVVLGTSILLFVKISAAGALLAVNNLGDVASPATSLANLGGAPLASPALTGVPTAPTAASTDNTTQIATDAFVQAVVANAVAGVNPAVAVQAATTAAGDTSGLTYTHVAGVGDFFTGSVNTAITIDGHTLVLGDRVLIKNDTQSTSGAFNGVYLVTRVQTGVLAPILTRALDYDTPTDINNTGAIPVTGGTVNGTTSWLNTAQVVTVGTTPLVYVKFSINPASLAAVATSGSASDLGTGTLPNARLALDSTAADIKPPGAQAVGASGKAPDASHVHPGGATVVTATNATWPIPAGATQLRITAVGGGGGGAGGPSAASGAFNQAAGGGGGGGGATTQVVAVGANTTLAVTVGGGGAGGAAGAAGGGAAGTAGTDGSDTTVTGTSISITAKGGQGAPLAATSTQAANPGGACGGAGCLKVVGNNSGSLYPSPGQGGASGNVQGVLQALQAANGLGYAGSGGGGGGPCNAGTNKGGTGGGAGGIGAGGAGGAVGGAVSHAGTAGASAAANTGGGGGGGGAGDANGTLNAGGAGGAGGSGYVVIEVIG